MRPPANQPTNVASALARLFHSGDYFVLQPHVFQPDVHTTGIFIPGAARKGRHELPDELYSDRALVPDTSLLFAVANAGRSTWYAGDQFMCQHSAISAIELVTHGAGELLVGRQRFELLPGDVFLLHPGQRVVYRACSKEPFRKLFVTLSMANNAWRQLHDLLELRSVSRLRLAPTLAQRVQALLEHILATLRGAGDGAGLAASLATYELIVLLTRAARRPQDAQDLTRHLDPVLDYVLNHLHEPPRVAEVARVAKISPDHLNRVFVNTIGMRAHEWILKLRMRVAADLLSKTGLNVAEIAGQIGYQNPYSFYRAFTEVVGMTPGAFRRRAWKTR